jgi:glycosyltransferase involved in cell wall biosynthesis
MPLTVLSIAFPFAPVGPHCVGGAEQILTNLDAALVAAGHTSLVLACEGSTPAGKLFSLPRPCRPLEAEDERRWWRKYYQEILNRALSAYHVDLIHMHGLHFHEYSLPPDIPVLVTLHLPLEWYPSANWKWLPGHMRFLCVSHTQKLSCPAELKDVPVIVNGVDLSVPRENKRDFAITLGRICPEKNQHAALEAGFLAQTRVILGGQVFPWKEHCNYFREKIRPLLQQKHKEVRHKFCGPLSLAKRRRLVAQAKCLLHPTLAPETSSLVAMEALAAGTPVIAYRSGALQEIVEDGVTGFLVNSVEEMVNAIHRVHVIQPEACRSAAARRFSKERMIEQYFRLYHETVQSQRPQRLYA